MKSSYIAVGYACNHNCIICPCSTYDRLHKQQDLQTIKKAVLESNLSSGDHVVISGGEPTIHDDFYKILEFLSQQGIAITLLSNSEKFTDMELAKKLTDIVDTNSFDVVSAIHSCDPSVHDKITGVVGSFQKTQDGICNLLYCNINITIKQIINKLTYVGLPEWANFVIKNYSPRVEVQFTSMDYCGRAKKNLDELFITFDEIQPYLETALDTFEQEIDKRRIRIIEAPLCMLDPYYWKYYVDSGSVLNMYSAPNVENESGYTYDLANECGTYYNECGYCLVRKMCPGIWKSAYEIGGESLLRQINKQQ